MQRENKKYTVKERVYYIREYVVDAGSKDEALNLVREGRVDIFREEYEDGEVIEVYPIVKDK